MSLGECPLMLHTLVHLPTGEFQSQRPETKLRLLKPILKVDIASMAWHVFFETSQDWNVLAISTLYVLLKSSLADSSPVSPTEYLLL